VKVGAEEPYKGMKEIIMMNDFGIV